MRKASWMLAGTAMLALLATQTSAAELPGKFEGVTINAKLIGGQQYEALYSRIAYW
jgi:multiple sugar transport system substrate-binding protein